MADKIMFQPEDSEPVEFFVIEQTKLSGITYILVTDVEEGDGDALILKDLSSDKATESVYEIVTDETEMDAVAQMFESLLEDVDLIRDEE